MTDYTIRKLDDVPDAFGGQYPGTMRFLTEPLGNQQVAFTHRVMPPHTGGKGSYGHRHKTQEEIYYVISGRLQFKLGTRSTRLTAARQFACHPRRCVRSGTTDPPTPSSSSARSAWTIRAQTARSSRDSGPSEGRSSRVNSQIKGEHRCCAH